MRPQAPALAYRDDGGVDHAAAHLQHEVPKNQERAAAGTTATTLPDGITTHALGRGLL